jgi:hypothetical protein
VREFVRPELFNRVDAALPRIRDLRRRTSRLLNSAVAVELRNQLFRLTKLEERQRRKPKFSVAVLKRLSQRDEVLALTTRVAQHVELAVELEDTALLRLYSTTTELVAHSARVRFSKQTGLPEFYNRLDSVVTFSPLSAESIRTIAERKLDTLNEREGLTKSQRRLVRSPAVVELVTQAGFDAN